MSLLSARETKPLEGGASFSLAHRIKRGVWNAAWLLLAAWTPPPLHQWRGFVLRAFGADIHRSARVYGSARIWYPPNLTMSANAVLGPGAICYSMDKITLGEKSVVSQRAQLCCGTHDIADPDFQLVTRAITVHAGAWVAADAFIGPGVTIGEGAVIGARAVLFRDAESYGVYVGNPAILLKHRTFRTSATEAVR